ncbi:hypothetical protein AB6A40_002734, partial [Gnathostoma spinigerum]
VTSESTTTIQPTSTTEQSDSNKNDVAPKTGDARFDFLRQILANIKKQAEENGIDGTVQVSMVHVEPMEQVLPSSSFLDGFGEVNAPSAFDTQPQLPMDFNRPSPFSIPQDRSTMMGPPRTMWPAPYAPAAEPRRPDWPNDAYMFGAFPQIFSPPPPLISNPFPFQWSFPDIVQAVPFIQPNPIFISSIPVSAPEPVTFPDEPLRPIIPPPAQFANPINAPPPLPQFQGPMNGPPPPSRFQGPMNAAPRPFSFQPFVNGPVQSAPTSMNLNMPVPPTPLVPPSEPQAVVMIDRPDTSVDLPTSVKEILKLFIAHRLLNLAEKPIANEMLDNLDQRMKAAVASPEVPMIPSPKSAKNSDTIDSDSVKTDSDATSKEEMSLDAVNDSNEKEPASVTSADQKSTSVGAESVQTKVPLEQPQAVDVENKQPEAWTHIVEPQPDQSMSNANDAMPVPREFAVPQPHFPTIFPIVPPEQTPIQPMVPPMRPHFIGHGLDGSVLSSKPGDRDVQPASGIFDFPTDEVPQMSDNLQNTHNLEPTFGNRQQTLPIFSNGPVQEIMPQNKMNFPGQFPAEMAGDSRGRMEHIPVFFQVDDPQPRQDSSFA